VNPVWTKLHLGPLGLLFSHTHRSACQGSLISRDTLSSIFQSSINIMSLPSQLSNGCYIWPLNSSASPSPFKSDLYHGHKPMARQLLYPVPQQLDVTLSLQEDLKISWPSTTNTACGTALVCLSPIAAVFGPSMAQHPSPFMLRSHWTSTTTCNVLLVNATCNDLLRLLYSTQGKQ